MKVPDKEDVGVFTNDIVAAMRGWVPKSARRVIIDHRIIYRLSTIPRVLPQN